MWYSPPFYLGDITGLNLRLAVYPNGIKEGAGTHVSLVVECLERDLKEPKEMECGNYVNVHIIGRSDADSISSDTDGICSCKNSHDIWIAAVAQGGFHRKYKFITHKFAQKVCNNDTIKLQTKWIQSQFSCNCFCHRCIFYDDDDW